MPESGTVLPPLSRPDTHTHARKETAHSEVKGLFLPKMATAAAKTRTAFYLVEV